MAVTSSNHFDNNTVLYGKDIFEIKEDSAFGKIVFLEIDNIDEETAFNKIKELELVRYNYCPEGFMTRASALNMREQIRVSKKAIKKKISFEDYGNALIEQYLQNPIVKSVQIIFITDFDKFDELYLIADKIKNTTSALNHILDNVIFDCKSCNLKEICDEVEGMKELHMKKAKN
jgi:CO dehydrogenase/acetyl-CoA synthase beta subunit